MPKYSLNVNLLASFIETPDLSITDVCVLDYLRDICISQNQKIVEKRVTNGDKIWTWVDYSHLLEELPYLHIQSTGTISKIIKRLKEHVFIDTERKSQNRIYIRILGRTDNLFTSRFQDNITPSAQIIKIEAKEEKKIIYTEKDNEIIEKIFNFYKKKINENVRLTKNAKEKIYMRLKEFEPKELALSIRKFSNNSWRMENNSDKGLLWFFKSEDQIVKFLGLNEDIEQERFNFV